MGECNAPPTKKQYNMSRFIATKIIVNKDGTIVLNGYENNLFPHYGNEVKLNDLKALYEHMKDGTIQPLKSANGYKWSAIQCYLRSVYGPEYTFEQFKQVLEHPGNKGSYIFFVVRPDGDHYFNGTYLTNSKDIATKYTFWQALHRTFDPSRTFKWYRNLKCVDRNGTAPWFWKYRNNEIAAYDI